MSYTNMLNAADPPKHSRISKWWFKSKFFKL